MFHFVFKNGADLCVSPPVYLNIRFGSDRQQSIPHIPSHNVIPHRTTNVQTHSVPFAIKGTVVSRAAAERTGQNGLKLTFKARRTPCPLGVVGVVIWCAYTRTANPPPTHQRSPDPSNSQHATTEHEHPGLLPLPLLQRRRPPRATHLRFGGPPRPQPP